MSAADQIRGALHKRFLAPDGSAWADVERWEAQALTALASLEVELKRKEDALRPFAAVADEILRDDYNEDYLLVWRSGAPSVMLKHDDLVHARAALGEPASGEEA